MDTTRFGRTGLEVTRMGLGGGGPSRLGVARDDTHESPREVVRAALDCGITTFDTAASYQTEPVVGAVLKEVPRDSVVISSKVHGGIKGQPKTPAQVEAAVDKALQQLRTDYLDVYMIHALLPDRYDIIAPKVLPALQLMKQKGKIRFIGVSEMFGGDSGHTMLQRALADDCWDVVMVGFNILNISARQRVIEEAQRRDVGVYDMFAVRKALRDTNALGEYLDNKISGGVLDENARQLVPLVSEAIQSGLCKTLPELAYRYCLSQPGIHCVLSGTSSPAHIRENARAVDLGPLPEDFTSRLESIVRTWDFLCAQ